MRALDIFVGKDLLGKENIYFQETHAGDVFIHQDIGNGYRSVIVVKKESLIEFVNRSESNE